MSASRGHGKGRKHEKPKHDGKPSETEKPIEKQVRKLGLEVEILAVVVAIAIIAVLFVLSSDMMNLKIQGGEDTEANVTLDTCMSRNPGMTEQGCLDMEYQEKAVLDNDPEICKLIVSEDVRNHCLRYFGLYR